jgi:prophage antirepressor-like protein
MKVIFRSNSGVAYKFRDWANKVVYTSHLGTEEQRFEQALDMAGVNANLVKQVFDTS